MSIRELLDKLGLNKYVGTYSNQNSYVIDIKDSDEWGRINSKLYASNLLDYQDEVSFLNMDNGNQVYNYEDEYQITLMNNFEEDTYQLVISEM